MAQQVSKRSKIWLGGEWDRITLFSTRPKINITPGGIITLIVGNCQAGPRVWPTCFILYASTILCCSDPEEQSSCVLDHIETARSLDTPGSAIVMSSTQPPTAGEPSKPRSSPVPKANDEPPRQRILVLGWRKCVVVVSDSNAS